MKQKMNIAICDDEDYFVKQIQFACESVLEVMCDEFEIFIFHSGEELIGFSDEEIDLLFLDIELGGIDGISVLKEIIHKEDIRKVVFVSTHEEMVWDTFSTKTLGFARKPVSEEEIGKYIQWTLKELQKDITLIFKKNDEDSYIKLSELFYIEGLASYVEVHSQQKNFVVTGKLGYWEEKLQDMHIIRIHKSYLVNLQNAQIEGNEMIIDSTKERLPIGRKYKKIVQEDYSRYVMEHMREQA